jgi:hypothetical protein
MEGVQTINGVKLERSFRGDESEPIRVPVNESPDEYENRHRKEFYAAFSVLKILNLMAMGVV